VLRGEYVSANEKHQLQWVVVWAMNINTVIRSTHIQGTEAEEELLNCLLHPPTPQTSGTQKQ